MWTGQTDEDGQMWTEETKWSDTTEENVMWTARMEEEVMWSVTTEEDTIWAAKTEEDSGFCSGPLWDEAISWETENPDFTTCFHQVLTVILISVTVLIVIKMSLILSRLVGC